MPKISRRTALRRGGQAIAGVAAFPVAVAARPVIPLAPKEDAVLRRLSLLMAELRNPPDNSTIHTVHILLQWIADRIEEKLAKRRAS